MKTRFTVAEYIARPPAEVFAVLSNPALAPSFLDHITRIEKLTHGPLDVGSRFRETRRIRGRESVTELTLSRFEPDTHVSVCSGGDGIVVIYHYALTPQAAGTRIDWSCQLLGRGLRKLMLPMVAAILKAQDVDHLQKLKGHLESASPAY